MSWAWPQIAVIAMLCIRAILFPLAAFAPSSGAADVRRFAAGLINTALLAWLLWMGGFW